jgi:hypothetical protein
MLEEWDLGLGRSAAERRIALRMSRERATLIGQLTTDDEADAKAFVESQRIAYSSAPRCPSRDKSGTEAHTDDDLDALQGNDDIEDEMDDEIDEDTYYSDAFEDS